MVVLRRLPIVLTFFTLAACDMARGEAQFTARDSAGVRIVEHTSLAGLRVRTLAADTPEVRLGSDRKSTRLNSSH